MAPRTVRSLALLSIPLAATLLAASGAQASTGSYQVSACNFASEAANNSWIWSSSDQSSPDHYEQHVNCPDRTGGSGGRSDQEGGLSTTDALGLSSGAPPETSAGWIFTAPVGTTIAGITYERYLGHVFDASNYWAPALRADGAVIAGESCLDTIANSESCYVGGPPGEGVEAEGISGLSAHELSFGIQCQAHAEEQCVTGGSQHETWAAMFGATVMLEDTHAPTLAATTGPLWETGGYSKGTESLTTAAEDVGGGVKSITLSVDGHGEQNWTAACDYTSPIPCPSASGSQILALQTGTLSDGIHTIALQATDAAGNTSASAERQIDVENDAPPPPSDLLATPLEPGSLAVQITWSNPANPTAPITSASYELCPADGASACVSGTAQPTGSAVVTLPRSGLWTVALWLVNAAGNGAATNAARTEVLLSAASPGTSVMVGPGSGPEAATLPGSVPPITKAPGAVALVRVAKAVHGRLLVVRLRGPHAGIVHVRYTARERGRVVAAGTRRVALHRGYARVVFRLTRRAEHVPIRVVARLVAGG
jgi:hypothetical protein